MTFSGPWLLRTEVERLYCGVSVFIEIQFMFFLLQIGYIGDWMSVSLLCVAHRCLFICNTFLPFSKLNKNTTKQFLNLESVEEKHKYK